MAKEVIYIDIEQLRTNSHQPEGRTEPSKMKTLTASIKREGLQYPILIFKRDDGTYEVIDGHRRLAVLRAEKHEKVPCIVADGNPDQIFAAVNATVRAVSGLEWAYIFVEGGPLPKGVTKNNLEALAKLIGNDGIRDMIARGVQPGVYQGARRVAKYIYGGQTTDDKVREIVQWLINHKQMSNCLAVINQNQSADTILDALRNDGPVKY